MAVNIQNPIPTSYLLCVVYTILAFLTDNKNVKCASICVRVHVHAYVCEICVCMDAAVTANDFKNAAWSLEEYLFESVHNYGFWSL